MSPNRIVFLDIDGVIISGGAAVCERGIFQSRKLMPYCSQQVTLLKEFCERTGAKIVFNTTHSSSLLMDWRYWVKYLFDTNLWKMMANSNSEYKAPFWKRVYYFLRSKVPDDNIKTALIKAGIPKDMFHEDIRTKYPNGERLRSIGWWLDAHPEVGDHDWVAFDDVNLEDDFLDEGLTTEEREAFRIGSPDKQFVLINPAVGLDIDSLNQVLDDWGHRTWIVCI